MKRCYRKLLSFVLVAILMLCSIPPDLLDLPKGCAFADRCPEAKERCREHKPEETVYSKTHSCSCWECQ